MLWNKPTQHEIVKKWEQKDSRLFFFFFFHPNQVISCYGNVRLESNVELRKGVEGGAGQGGGGDGGGEMWRIAGMCEAAQDGTRC